MNKDHQLALTDYVVVYATVEPDNLVDGSAKISKVDTDQLVIEYRLKSNPDDVQLLSMHWYDALEDEKVQVKELKDVKSKLISMAKYCARRQGYSHRRLSKVVGPSWGGLGLCLWILVLALNTYNPQIIRAIIGKDAILGKLFGLLPSIVRLLYSLLEVYSGKILVGVVVLHLAEMLFITRNLLRRYRAPPNQRWVWYAMQFFEGALVIKRIKNVVS